MKYTASGTISNLKALKWLAFVNKKVKDMTMEIYICTCNIQEDYIPYQEEILLKVALNTQKNFDHHRQKKMHQNWMKNQNSIYLPNMQNFRISSPFRN